MPRGVSKTSDESIFEIPNYWGKVFMYTSPSWNVLYPVVDIIRSFPKHTIISHAYTKGQQTIKLYGNQYNHCVIGTELKKKNDFVALKMVKFIFVFSDTQDTLATNIIEYAKKIGIPLICYSTIDNMYHFTSKEKTVLIKKPEDIQNKMQEISELNHLSKFDELFPEFTVLEPDKAIENTLDKCIEILNQTTLKEKKKKVFSEKVPFDANFNKLKIKEKQKKQLAVKYDDELPTTKPVSSLSSLFKKRI